jgi:hypothetical protein
MLETCIRAWRRSSNQFMRLVITPKTLTKTGSCATTHAEKATAVSALCAGSSALLASATMEPTATNLIPTAAVLATSLEIFVIETLISMA